MKRPDTPFPRHWRYYIVLKYLVLAAAVALALKYFGVRRCRPPASVSICSTRRSATARRPMASTFRSTTSSPSCACSTSSASIISRAVIRAANPTDTELFPEARKLP